MKVEPEFYGRNDRDRFDANTLALQIREAGHEWADLDAAADLLESEKRSYLAQMTNQRRAAFPTLSRKEAEDIAIASAEYMTYLKSCNEARRLATRAKANYEAVQVFARAYQTEEVSRRAEMAIR